MASWLNIFGGGAAAQRKAGTVPAENKFDRDKIQSALDTMQKKVARQDTEIDEINSKIKAALAAGKRDEAKRLIPRRKVIEQMQSGYLVQIVNLQASLASVDNANINSVYVGAQQAAVNAMQRTNKNITPQSIERLQDQMQEQQDIAHEINSVLTVNHNELDESEIDAELEAMQQEVLDDKMLSTGSVPTSDWIHSMPSAARGEPGRKAPQVAEEDDMEEELKKLQAEMAM